jgi:hypothetical protein
MIHFAIMFTLMFGSVDQYFLNAYSVKGYYVQAIGNECKPSDLKGMRITGGHTMSKKDSEQYGFTRIIDYKIVRRGCMLWTLPPENIDTKTELVQYGSEPYCYSEDYVLCD